MSQPPGSTVGGQAVIEGVMIRSPQAWSVAVRRPDGDIETRTDPLPRLSSRSRLARIPFIRGVMVLGESLSLGFRALTWSAQIASTEEDAKEKARLENLAANAGGPLGGWRRNRATRRLERGSELTKRDLAFAMALALVFFIGVFMLLPLGGARLVENLFGGSNAVVFNVAEGIIRVVILVGYIWLIGRSAEIRRVFQYHGAEHKSIYAYEAGDPMTVQNVQVYQTMHPRCGTSFLLLVVLLSVLVFTFVGLFEPNAFWLVTSRIVLIPVIAGLSYEVLKLSDAKPWLHFLARPGIELQRLTTKEPDDGQVEVAIASLLAAIPGEARDEVFDRGPICEVAWGAVQ
ncbi:MAG: DUF1385 domain-containing protein [Acidimicrobiia bacterium]|nr:DUF1385 domain-containing protein [Acidimicrobiia bacterium]MBT8216181.1 DUF1385 domain-containing protein [Acidimicrobiia bacterium]NNF09581.1 DUF1385 domain-containing protein [Acidimicrobiia bacterium]NNL70043.1 DUF1385 domain-containing protein [Acidimicrobiia bacterium]